MLEIYKEAAELIAKGELMALATVMVSRGSAPRKAGAKMLIRKDGTSIGSVGGGGVERQIVQKAVEIMSSGEPQMIHLDLSGRGEQATMICGGQIDIFIEPILPPETLWLFGAGHISKTTAAMGKLLGFKVSVVDPRPEHNNRDQFPDADSLIVEEFADSFAKLNIDKNSYIVIFTTGHTMDEQCLHFALGTEATYIGMIGSEKKVKEVEERLLKKGVSAERLNRIHAPIGLEIGAETPQEIAVSILAEIIKVKRGD